MAKVTKKTKKKSNKNSEDQMVDELIVIDEKEGLIFENEGKLYQYFQPQIDFLENEYQDLRTEQDFSDDDQLILSKYFESTLDEADQIWKNDEMFEDFPVFTFVKIVSDPKFGKFHFLVLAYVSGEDDVPTFVFTYFPTKDLNLLKKYLRTELVYDKEFEELQNALIEGDALSEGDPLAIGLFKAMKVLRSEKDIAEVHFQKAGELREDTIQEPDEIWRKNDLDGNVLVFFIRHYPDHELGDLFYIVATQEEPDKNIHALLFSFPTNDESLVDRYRQGENLQAEEVSQESSH